MKHTFYLIVAVTFFAIGCGDTASPSSDHSDSEATSEIVTQGYGVLSVSLPDDLPDDIPMYSGAKPIYLAKSKGRKRQPPMTTINLESTDTVKKIHAFYEKEMQSGQWMIDKKSPTSLTAKIGKRYLHVFLLDIPKRPGTTVISVTYSRNDKPEVE